MQLTATQTEASALTIMKPSAGVLAWLMACLLLLPFDAALAQRLPVREWSGRWEIIDLPAHPRFGDAFARLMARKEQGGGGEGRGQGMSVLVASWTPQLSFHSSVRGGIPGLFAAQAACRDHRGAVRIQAEAIRFTPDAGTTSGGMHCDPALAGIDEDFGARLNAVRRWQLASNGADWSQMIWRLELLDVRGKPLLVLQRR
jgi:hypothetical protein